MSFFDSGNIHFYIAIFLSILNGGILAFISSKFLQVLQQSAYDMKGYFTWLRGTRYKYLSRLFTLGLLSIFCAVVTNALLDVYHNNTLYSYVGIIFYFYFSAVFIFNLVKEPNKIPLVRTKRIGRIFGLLFVLYAVATFFLIAISTEYLLLIRFGIITLTPVLVPIIVVLAFYMILPLENLINKIYIKKAKNKLKKMKNLIKIGITGSYGKTTTKFILEKMLAYKYKTLASMHSYNTPLGLTKVILQDLTFNHEVFIAEMGAKKVGDIKTLCEFIKPNHAIITSVGSQHMETFKNQKNITNEKFALAKSIKNGYVIFNGNNEICEELFEEYENDKKLISYGNENEKGFCFIKEIEASVKGTSFTLMLKKEEIKCKTKLLGKHNLQNIAMCASLAYKLGVSKNDIQKAINELTATKHRLEIVKSNDKNLIVIDDSYNASVEGTLAALDVLSLFSSFQKIIITPGIIEMGKLETNVNFEFGKNIAEVCDFVIIVNNLNHEAIKNGLLKENFDEEKIFFVDSLKQANEKLALLTNKKSVVLFENDLPDLFIY